MSLNRKIVVLLIAGISLYTVVGYGFHQYLILPGFLRLEQNEARKDMRRCVEALENQLHQIDLLCFDWSAWDNTYDFLETRDPEYIEANLVPESFTENEISLIY